MAESHEKSENGFGYANDKNLLNELELKMKDLWSEYTIRLDKEGQTESTLALRNKYYSLYREFRKHRDWTKLIGKENDKFHDN